MKRICNNREIELLAPVGTYQDFEQIIRSAADAVYFGGKKFNMRMHNAKHNLSNEEIVRAVFIAHELEKKVYVTFNNMMTDSELEDAKSYLGFLDKAGIDGLIVQDFGAVQLIKELELSLPIHLSIMANVHNEEMIQTAEELGVTRCLISREYSIAQAKQYVKDYPEMEYEYFIHGDMCIAHGAQCYSSGVFFGKSGNRGLCMKPCRWAYQGEDEQKIYPMAVKDMCMYQHIPELVSSGINSFKIEGRMRGADYLVSLINIYGEAIDRFLAAPSSYELDVEQMQYLEEHRVRDFSTAYAFKTPGFSNIAIDGTREPRVFSRPNEEPEIKKERVSKILNRWAKEAGEKRVIPEIRVTVDTVAAAIAAIEAGVDSLYLSGEVLKPNPPFTKSMIQEVCQTAAAKGIPVFYVLPRMMNDEQLAHLDELVKSLPALGVQGLLCSNLGEISRYGELDLELRGDYGLNVYNQYSGSFFRQKGLKSVTLSIEAPADILGSAAQQMTLDTEVIVQGTPTLMYMEHSFSHARAQRRNELTDPAHDNENLDLVDERGFIRKIRVDQYGKNHLLPTKDFDYVSFVPEFSAHDVKALRIEGKTYDAETLKQVIRVYQSALKTEKPLMEQRMKWVSALEKATQNPQSLQTLAFN